MPRVNALAIAVDYFGLAMSDSIERLYLAVLAAKDSWEWVTFEREEDAPAALSRLFALPAG